ncbi:FAD-binding protein [Streptomyces syringium]|uniref:FAD-binding protein n=1 Tax=Streptomyces syringium TaxID=76729 RepID=UPI00343E3568
MTGRPHRRGHAIVLGSGIAGMLTAAALAEHTGTVTIVERDRLPRLPVPRKGVPQGRHLHGLLSGGIHAIERLLPGTYEALIAGGARRIGLGDEALIYGPHGWMCPVSTPYFLIGASRPFVEHTVRTHLLQRYAVTVREATEAVELVGDARHVRGVRVRDRNTGRHETLVADLVVDATGCSAKTPHWFTDLGLPAVGTTVVDSGLAYATATIRPTAAGLPVSCATVQPDPRAGGPGRAGFLLRTEGGQWMVTLSGTRGAHPPLDEAGFRAFAYGLRHPALGELLDAATLTTRVFGYRATANRRRHYERIPAWPHGFLAVGDSVVTFNPLYGQGMTVAAQSALALHHMLRDRPVAALDTHAVQRALCHQADLPWAICTTEDIRYPQAVGAPPSAMMRTARALTDRIRATAACSAPVARAYYGALSLTVPPSRLLTPSLLMPILLGPRHPPLREPQHRPAKRPSPAEPEA